MFAFKIFFKQIVSMILMLVFCANGMTSTVSSEQIHEEVMPTGCSVLIITPKSAIEDAGKIAELLSARFGVDGDIIESDQYAPLSHEYSYAGFVYIGSEYEQPPKQGFLEDVLRTSKPVLWIHYHAWLLDPEFLKARGINILDEHSEKYTAVVSGEVKTLAYPDSTKVNADTHSVNYWIYDAAHIERTPGSVSQGNFTYLSYTPVFYGNNSTELALVSDLARFTKPLLSGCGQWPDYDQRVQQARDDKFHTGVHLPIYVSDSEDGQIGYESDRLHDNLLLIRNSGAEWVTLSQIYYQRGKHASEIFSDTKLTPSFTSLANVVEDAHRLGLLVRLSPILNLTEESKEGDDWRGFIHPDNPSQWWDQYRKMILSAARFARDNDIESLNIGAELNVMQRYRDQWMDLIAAVKNEAEYKGLIGYQVNFDALNLMDWGEALDYVAIAAYWPLSEDRDPTLDTLMRSWANIDQLLVEWKSKQPGISIEFGEIGYASQPYSSVLPYSWKPHKGGAVSIKEQEVCYRALHDYLASSKVVEGVHIFALTTDEQDSIGYTPYGKPAYDVMEQILKLR